MAPVAQNPSRELAEMYGPIYTKIAYRKIAAMVNAIE